MRLFLISNMYPSSKSPGYGVFVKNFRDQLEKQKVIFSYAALLKGKTKNKGLKLLKYVIFYLKIIWYYFGSYDVIYVHYPSHVLPILYGLSKIKKKEIIFNFHGSDLEVKNRILKKFLFLLKSMDQDTIKYVVPSYFFKEQITKKLGVDPQAIFVYPSGGVAEHFFQNNARKQSSTIFTLGYVSRLDEGKGWDVFLRALGELKEQQKEMHYRAIVIGNGNQQAKFYEMLEALDLTKEVEYISFVVQKELPAIYRKMDVFIFPTLRAKTESLGLVGLEAMAAGTPVIGSKLGGLQDYIVDESNGFFFEPGHVKQLVEQICRYYAMAPAAKRKMQQNAVIKAEEYNSNKVAVALYSMLNSFIEKKK